MALPTVDDLKSHLNLSGAENDSELANMLDAAVEMVADMVGPLTLAPVTEIHRNVSADLIVLRRCPVIELTDVSYRSGGTLTSLSLDDFEVDPDAGIVRSTTDSRLVGTFQVSYLAGREALPASIRLAVMIIAAHMWETQTRPGFTSSIPAGFGGADGVPDAGVAGGSGYAVPNRAMELLRAYMIGASFA